MDKLISVIIPVYNSQGYLSTCFDCLSNQTYKNFEVIFIDDGSSDNSFEIIKSFEEKDKRFHAYTQENSGVSAARNRGLELAKGEYIAYIDADDKIKPDYFERLLSDAVKYSADIVCCGYEEKKHDENNNEILLKTISNNEELKTDAKGCYDDCISSGRYLDVVWAKIIKKEFASLAKFAPIRYGEDTRYMLEIIGHKPAVYLSSYIGYEYIRWENSATLNPNITSRQYENYKNWISMMDEYIFPNISETLMKKAKKLYINMSANYLLAMVRNEKKQEFLEYKNNKLFAEISKEKYNLSIKVWIIIKAYKLNPHFGWIVIKLLKRN